MTRLIHRLQSVLIGLAFAASFGVAHAANITMLNCAGCANTTSSFTSAARNQSLFDQTNRTYIMPSDSSAATAFIRVQGAWTHTAEPYWYVTSAVPVDANSVTLASQGYSEAQMENYYATTDAIDLGMSRADPTLYHLYPIPGNLPQVGSFINSDDNSIGTVIDNMLPGIARYGTGDVIEVVFADGTRAEFQCTGATQGGAKTWLWTGIAWDSSGRRIDRGGHWVAFNQMNGTPHGVLTVRAFGTDPNTGFNYQWLLALEGQSTNCWTQSTITINGSVDSTFAGFVPCN